MATLGEKHLTAPDGISVGIASAVPASGRTVENLLGDADACLYEASNAAAIAW